MRTSFRTLHVTFAMEGQIYYDPLEPVMLDGVLQWLLMPLKGQRAEPPSRDDAPEEIGLPFALSTLYGQRIFHASAIVPAEEAYESLRTWRKKVRQDKVEMIRTSICTGNGPMREYNVPMPVIACSTLEAWCVGNRRAIRMILKKLKYLGKKRSQGLGRIAGITVEHAEADYSLVRNGQAMRWLPQASGGRLVRMRPPYWSRVERVPACEIGDPYILPE